MAAVLFIVLIPKKEYELDLRKKSVSRDPKIESKDTSDLKYKDSTNPESTSDGSQDCGISLSTCKSTDLLHDKSRFKSDNDIKLSVDGENYLTSWEELKQILRFRKNNKLKITSSLRGLDILLAFHSSTPLEVLLSEVLQRLHIENASWSQTKNNEFWQVTFSLKSQSCEETLAVLRALGVGSRSQSAISVLPCTLYYQGGRGDAPPAAGTIVDSDSAWSRFTSSVRARTNLAQVLNDVRADGALTFDWLFLLTVAAFVAAIGLVENSTVILVASMLISPLMGPITAGTLGTTVKDRSLQSMGVQNELLGLFLSLMIGFSFGLTICAVDERYGVGDWPTYEMLSRCEVRSLWVGVLVAIPSGAAVALAVLGEYTASLVGVAISASLLPPAVNAGLLWAMSLVIFFFLEDEARWNDVISSHRYSDNPAVELAVLGAMSLCLTLVNIVCIFFAGVLVYKVKEVTTLEKRTISWWRSSTRPQETSRRNQDSPCSWSELRNSQWYNPEEFEKENHETNTPNQDKKVNEDNYYLHEKPVDKTIYDISNSKSNDKIVDSKVEKELVYNDINDTITFRRPALRTTIKNIEKLLDLNDSVAPSPTENSLYEVIREKEDDESYENKSDITVTPMELIENNPEAFKNRYNFHNLNFGEKQSEPAKDEPAKEEPATIDPSLSYTANSKKSSLQLTNTTFDV